MSPVKIDLVDARRTTTDQHTHPNQWADTTQDLEAPKFQHRALIIVNSVESPDPEDKRGDDY